MTGAAITVLHVKRVERGQLRALVKVRLGGLVLHQVSVIEPDDGAPYVAMPMAPTRGAEDGAKAAGWLPVVDFVNPLLLNRVRAAVLAAYLESAS